MAVPAFYVFIEPLLRYLAAHPEGVRSGDAYEAVASAMALSPEDRAALLPSGNQPVYQNRLGWAHDRLKRAALSSSPRRGLWVLTEEGKQFHRAHPTALTPDEVRAIWYIRREDGAGDEEEDEDAGALPTVPSQSPEELIQRGFDEIRESVSRDLLERILAASPAFFENLVLELLHTMGYGTSREALEAVGGSGDGGIDGVISLDRLGLEKVYVQAKRWRNQVPPSQVRDFYGALAGRRANKGVFITTSTFSPDAREFAKQVERIVLVDGVRLAALMIEHGVAVQHRVLKVPRVDGDYFEEA